MADPLFQVGERLKARREPRLLLLVGAVGIEEPQGRMYQCVVDQEQAASERGRSTRWFREGDLMRQGDA